MSNTDISSGCPPDRPESSHPAPVPKCQAQDPEPDNRLSVKFAIPPSLLESGRVVSLAQLFSPSVTDNLTAKDCTCNNNCKCNPTCGCEDKPTGCKCTNKCSCHTESQLPTTDFMLTKDFGGFLDMLEAPDMKTIADFYGVLERIKSNS